MKKISRIFVSVFICLFSLCALATPKSVLQLSGLLKNFSTYSATFNQVTYSEQGRALQKSYGKMQIKRPGKFRWESQKPTHQILVTNGKTLWIYDVDLAQATKQKLSTRTTIDPAMLLSGSIKNLSDNFNISEKGSSREIVFELVPKKSDLGFKQVTLTFENKKLSQMKVINNLSQTTIFNFTNIKLNLPMSDNLFNFKPKPGVDIISQ